jgi:hypothetical protein
MNKRLNLVPIVIAVVLILLTVTGQLPGTRAEPAPEPPERVYTGLLDQSATGNLLLNGDMDQLPFYWRPHKDFVAGRWYQWWSDRFNLPEYIDGGIPNHNQCYPTPADGLCHNPVTGQYNSSQGYIRWGAAYDAGIYQPVAGTTPCLRYTFEIYNRNDAANYHTRIGIDPTGWIITALGSSGPHNCPPDGNSQCPDPYIAAFPPTIIWSPAVNHPAYQWGPLSFTVEAVAHTISVWTRATPDGGNVSYSTYWDNGSVIYTPFPGNLLPQPASPAPSGYIQPAASFNNGLLTLTWNTADPASTQVLYEVTRAPITGTVPLTNSTFLPLIRKTIERVPFLNPTPVLQHSFSIPGLQVGDVVDYVALSRRVLGNGCVTETSGPMRVTIAPEGIVTLALDPAESQRLWESYTP